MTPTAGTPALGFLAALAAITRHEDFSVKIEAEDAGLRVTIQVGGHAPLEAIGRPAALDAQLPAAIRKYALWIDDQAASGEVEIELPGAVPAPKPAAPRKKIERRKPAARKPASRKAAAARPRKPKKSAAPGSLLASLPGKPECIADYKATKARLGDKMNRRKFVDNSKTGRRYEKLWGNSWPAFVKEAEGAAAGTPPAPKSAAAPKPAAAAKPPAKKPKKETPPEDDKRPWTVKEKGKGKLGATIFEKKPGDTYTCSAGKFTVESVDAGKREIYVVPEIAAGIQLPGATSASPPPSSTPAAATGEATGEQPLTTEEKS